MDTTVRSYNFGGVLDFVQKLVDDGTPVAETE